MKLILAQFFQWIEEREVKVWGWYFVLLAGMCVNTLIKFSVLFNIQAESTMNLHHEQGKQSSFFTPIHVAVVFCVFDSFCSSYICNKEKKKSYPRLSNKVISPVLKEFLRLSDNSF